MPFLDERSLSLRETMLNTLYKAGRGHLPSAYSCTEILRVLYDAILRFRPEEPGWMDRDRLILSKGHGCLALYALLADKGFFPKSELDAFCAFHSSLGGHPERGLAPGVEATTGSLGHGLSLGVGMALAARLDARPSRVFVICGDGESNEGSVWEACLSASKHRLSSLTLIIDYNKQQSWDSTEKILPLEPYQDKFQSFGFSVVQVDGHDIDALQAVFAKLPLEAEKPSCIICHTIKGKGITSLEGNLSWHHKTHLTEHQYAALKMEMRGRAGDV